MKSHLCFGVLAFALDLLFSMQARALVYREVEAGATALPMTGMKVDLPSPGGEDASWALSATWSYRSGVGWRGYEGRDIIDLRRGGVVVRRTHVEVRRNWACSKEWPVLEHTTWKGCGTAHNAAAAVSCPAGRA
jgi:hypothetical protein